MELSTWEWGSVGVWGLSQLPSHWPQGPQAVSSSSEGLPSPLVARENQSHKLALLPLGLAGAALVTPRPALSSWECLFPPFLSVLPAQAGTQ